MSSVAKSVADPPAKRRPLLRMPQIPRWVDTLFVFFGAALLVYVVSRYSVVDLAAACRTLGPSVVLVFVLPVGWHASGAAAVFVLLERRVPWRKIFWARLAAEAYNSLFFSVGGEPFRIRFLSRFVPTDLVLAAMVRDRVLDMTSGYFVSAAFLFYCVPHYALPSTLRVGLTVYATVTLALGIAGGAVVVTRIPGRFGALITRFVGGSASSAAARLPAGTLASVLPFYVLSRALGVLEIGVLLRLLGGRFVIAEAGFFDCVLNAAGAISFFLPGALGVFEGTSAYLFGLLGLGGPQGVVFGLVRRARMLLISAVGIALHWLGRRAMLAPATSTAARRPRSELARTVRRYAYTLWRAPRGIGRPQAAAQWDAEYRAGQWRKLDSTAQLGHYALIAGYVGHLFSTPPSVVDVGCGHGQLFKLLRRSGYRRYVGLDLSAEAIDQASSLLAENARFEVADFTTWRSEEPFDVIIFNESIYYARDPLQQLDRYLQMLSEGGAIVLSIAQNSMNVGVSQRIRRAFEVICSSRLRNEHGETWEVSVIRQRRGNETTGLKMSIASPPRVGRSYKMLP